MRKSDSAPQSFITFGGKKMPPILNKYPPSIPYQETEESQRDNLTLKNCNIMGKYSPKAKWGNVILMNMKKSPFLQDMGPNCNCNHNCIASCVIFACCLTSQTYCIPEGTKKFVLFPDAPTTPATGTQHPVGLTGRINEEITQPLPKDSDHAHQISWAE